MIDSKYRDVVERASDAICIIQGGLVKYANPWLAGMYGGSVEELIDTPFINYIHPDDIPVVRDRYDRRMAGEQVPSIYQATLRRKDGSKLYAELNIGLVEYLGKPAELVIIRDITERKKLWLQQELNIKLLEIINKRGAKKEVIQEILVFIKEFSGCEAVGLRLKEGDDFPYYQTNGFITGHVEAENRLCAFDDGGEIIRDSLGDPVLECMCGNIIRGRFDPTKPFFTKGGSFWTNSTTELLASTTEDDRQARTRNRCNGEGYESVALIPLRLEGNVIGLLQLNDSRRDCFTADLIAYYEGIGQSVGIALAHQQMEEALRESEAKLKSIFNNVAAGVIITVNRVFTEVNQYLCDITGYSREELLNKSARMLYTTEEMFTSVGDERKKRMADKGAATLVTKWQRKDGGLIDVLINSTRLNPADKSSAITSVILDITKSKQAEEALRQSEERYRTILEVAIDGIAVHDIGGRMVEVNDSYCRMIGYTREELLTMSIPDIEAVEKPEETAQHVKKMAEQGYDRFETQHKCKDGKIIDLAVSATHIDVGGGQFFVSVRDITERRKAEETLRQSEQRYRDIFENAVAGIFRSSAEGRFITVNDAFARMFGFSDSSEIISEITDIDNQLYANPEDRKELARVLSNEGVVNSWEVKMRRRDGSDIWTSSTIHAVKDYSGKLLYLDGICIDITGRKRAEEERQQGYQRMQRGINGATKAIASISEARDPYTAGHQQKVAKLACAIAEELGFPQEKIEAIRVAGVLHDIGKINVPAEILSRPGKLSKIEMDMVKTHPRTGNDILETLELPWVICPIVLQHHERMDGSGYPSGLLGKDISIEAKILAVADVVEAMDSHRPYRPALGIDKALEEITENKGKLYDPDVVDACLKLFVEKGFEFE